MLTLPSPQLEVFGVYDLLQCNPVDIEVCGSAYVQDWWVDQGAAGWAASEINTVPRPVNLGVVCVKPSGAEDDVVIADVCDQELNLLFMIGGTIT